MDRKCTRKFPALEYSCYNILIYNTVQTGIRAAAFCRSTLPPETPTQSIPESFPGVKKGRDVKLTTQKLLQTNNIKTNTIVDKTGYSGKPSQLKTAFGKESLYECTNLTDCYATVCSRNKFLYKLHIGYILYKEPTRCNFGSIFPRT